MTAYRWKNDTRVSYCVCDSCPRQKVCQAECVTFRQWVKLEGQPARKRLLERFLDSAVPKAAG